MKQVKICTLILCVLLLFSAMTGCKQPSGDQPVDGVQTAANFTYFDTVSYVYSYAGDPVEQFDERSAGVSRILQEYHRLFDIYHEYAGVNNLCTVNKQAGGDPVPVDPKLIAFMLYAKELYETTGGEMNIMMGAVLSIWHDYRTEAMDDPSAAKVPPMADLQEASTHTDISLLEIDEINNTLRITDPKASIDVGALGKGYATERAAQYLEADKASGYVLNIGGNIRIVGTKPDGSGWLTGIRNPSGEGHSAILNLSDISCVTSGSYERYYTVGNQRYHHIIDGSTLMPAAHFPSVSILTKDSGLADALSTALFCMPYEEGLQLANKLDGVEVLWIFEDGSVHCTDGLKDQLVEE